MLNPKVPKRKVLITEITGYLGKDVFYVGVYGKKFVIDEEEVVIPICYIGDTPFFLIEGYKVGRRDMDFFAVAQAPLIPYGDDIVEVDWKEGLRRYKRNLKKVIKK